MAFLVEDFNSFLRRHHLYERSAPNDPWLHHDRVRPVSPTGEPF